MSNHCGVYYIYPSPKKKNNMLTKIGIVDDHSITRKGVVTLLAMTNQFEVILEASSGKEILKSLSKLKTLPEIIILDLSMPDMDGYQTLIELNTTYPAIKILIFTFYQAEDVMLNAINKGACGFLNKAADPDLLLQAVQSIAHFGFYLTDQIKKKYSLKNPPKNLKGFHGKQVLTEKEIHFIRLASSNLTYKEIAQTMEVSPKTLENYRDSTFQKLGINNRAALTLYAIQNGIVHLF